MNKKYIKSETTLREKIVYIKNTYMTDYTVIRKLVVYGEGESTTKGTTKGTTEGEDKNILKEIVVFTDGKQFDYDYDDDELPEDADHRAREYVKWMLDPKVKPILIYEKPHGFVRHFEKEYKELVEQHICEWNSIQKIEKVECRVFHRNK